jgi:hypothetical protein
MTLALLDCPTGLAGDMLLASLLDLGLPLEVVEAPLASLGLAGRYRLAVEERRSGGLRGLHVQVHPCEPQPVHRPWEVLREQLDQGLAPPLRERVLAVFGLLAEAEAAVHGHPPGQVHFHEVGAIDALVDVVGVCAGLLHFGIDRLLCTLPPAGHGTVRTAHGLLPLPAPAVLEIARRRAIPLGSSEGFPAGELTTPTGLALIACWASGFGPPPAALPRRVGVGLGSRRLDRPNLLRLTLAEAVPTSAAADPWQGERCEPLLLQQAQIDDATPEDLAFLAEALREAGAVEVYDQPLGMKKGRAGILLSALLPPDRAAELRQVWWRHGTSLGVREQLHQRWILPRHSRRLPTDLGPVRLKSTLRPGGRVEWKAEHEDLALLARRHNLSLEEVRDVVRRAMEQER